MKLYNYWRSSSSYRVRLALAYKQLDYEYVAVSLVKGEQREAEHTARNPSGTVPVLEVEEGGRTVLLSQSMAIAEYLEERFPERRLFPADPAGRARVRELAELINSGIQPYHNLSVLNHVREALRGDPTAWAEKWVGVGLTALEAMARSTAGQFLYGDSVTWADCLLLPQLFAGRRFATVSRERYPTLLAIEDRLAPMDFVARAKPDAQPDATG